MQTGWLRIALKLMLLILSGCISQTEVQISPLPTASPRSPSPNPEPSPTENFISDLTDLTGRIDVYAPYQTLCPLGSGSTFINDHYAVLSCNRRDGIYLLLSRKEESGKIGRFINVMRVPQDSKKDFLVTSGNCDYQGQASREFLANLFILVRDIGNNDFKVIRVWRANFSTVQFEPLSPQETSLISSCMRAG